VAGVSGEMFISGVLILDDEMVPFESTAVAIDLSADSTFELSTEFAVADADNEVEANTGYLIKLN
jgi:hypothetical protein